MWAEWCTERGCGAPVGLGVGSKTITEPQCGFQVERPVYTFEDRLWGSVLPEPHGLGKRHFLKES